MKPAALLIGFVSLLLWLPLATAAEADLAGAIEARLLRLKRTAAARDELAAERDKLKAQYQALAMQLAQMRMQIAAGNQQSAVLTANYLQLQNEHAALTAQAIAASRTANAIQLQVMQTQIQGLQTQINTTNVSLGQVNAAINQTSQRAQVVETQGAGVQRSMQAVLRKLDEQQRDFIDHFDPFLRLSRAEHEAALPLFDAWLKADAENWAARLARSFVQRKLNKDEAALTDLTAVVDSQGSLSPLALAARGELKVARGSERDGMTDLAQASKADKKDTRILIFRGLANWRVGKQQAAEADFKLAVKTDKSDVEAIRHLTLLSAACDTPGARDSRKAVEYGEKAIELAKFTDWACFDALAAAHAEAGDFDEAVRAVGEAAALAFGENRESCLAHKKLYEARMPLRIKWK